jgi:hypothetical protein
VEARTGFSRLAAVTPLPLCTTSHILKLQYPWTQMDQNTCSTVGAKSASRQDYPRVKLKYSHVARRDRHVEPAVAAATRKMFKFWKILLSTRRVAKGDRSPSSLPPLKARELESTSTDLNGLTKDNAIIA